MKQLMIATERGIWRTDYSPGRALDTRDFHVDAPGRSVLSIHGRGHQLVALCEDQTLMSWESAARMFREEELRAQREPRTPAESPPSLEEFEPEFVHLAHSGAIFLGGCPAGVLATHAGSAWSFLGELESLPEAGGWQGLESPYEPRVTALLERASDCGCAERELYAAVSVGGLVRNGGEGWECVLPDHLPRDLRALAWTHERLWMGGGQGLWWWQPESGEYRRASLPPSAGFVAEILALPDSGLLLAAAGGPPATWRGPDGSRMSLWHFADENGVGRPIAGPWHGVVTGMGFDGEAALVGTDDGELWRVPLGGPSPEAPLLADLPRVRGLFLVDAQEHGG